MLWRIFERFTSGLFNRCRPIAGSALTPYGDGSSSQLHIFLFFLFARFPVLGSRFTLIFPLLSGKINVLNEAPPCPQAKAHYLFVCGQRTKSNSLILGLLSFSSVCISLSPRTLSLPNVLLSSFLLPTLLLPLTPLPFSALLWTVLLPSSLPPVSSPTLLAFFCLYPFYLCSSSLLILFLSSLSLSLSLSPLFSSPSSTRSKHIAHHGPHERRQPERTCSRPGPHLKPAHHHPCHMHDHRIRNPYAPRHHGKNKQPALVGVSVFINITTAPPFVFIFFLLTAVHEDMSLVYRSLTIVSIPFE